MDPRQIRSGNDEGSHGLDDVDEVRVVELGTHNHDTRPVPPLTLGCGKGLSEFTERCGQAVPGGCGAGHEQPVEVGPADGWVVPLSQVADGAEQCEVLVVLSHGPGQSLGAAVHAKG